MNKSLEFINEEKDRYGKFFVDINYAVDDIVPFLSKDQLSRRKYYVKLPILKRYIELLESSEEEMKKNGLTGFFKNDKYVDLLNVYKKDHNKDLNQLENCSNCKCLKCTAECSFDSCLGCREKSHIAQCDHSKINVTLCNSFILPLINNDTGKEDNYQVLATIQDCNKDQKYIILQSITRDEKLILYYYPGIKEDTYGEIKDEDEFDFIASTFESVE